MNITFRQVDAFRTVVSMGSVTNAAQVLGISQPAVSRLISDMETEVGFQLFRRSGRALEPTGEARLLEQEIRQAVSGLEHIKDSAIAIARFGHARLKIVTTPSFSNQLLPDLLGLFCKARPNSMARMEIEANDDSVEWMVSQNYDFGITASNNPNPSFERLKIKDENVSCLLPKGHRLADRPLIYARDLAGECFISYMPASRFRFETDQYFEAEKIDRQMQYETRTTDAICRLVARNLGVSVVGASVAHLNTMPGCVALPFVGPISYRAYLFWSKSAALSAIAQDFLEIVKTSISVD
jgi:DNA-binding transcriptional LysR family regulator